MPLCWSAGCAIRSNTSIRLARVPRRRCLHSAIALALPAAFEDTAGVTEGLGRLSVSLSVVLLITYAPYLTFTLITHPALFAGSFAAEEEKAPASVGRSVLVLAAATVGIAWMSEIMVAAIEPTTHEFGFSKVFVGVFVVAILGNAAEHATAISAALRDRMDCRYQSRSVRACKWRCSSLRSWYLRASLSVLRRWIWLSPLGSS